MSAFQEPGTLAVITREGRVVRVSPCCHELLGIPGWMLYDLPLTSLICPLDYSALLTRDEKVTNCIFAPDRAPSPTKFDFFAEFPHDPASVIPSRSSALLSTHFLDTVKRVLAGMRPAPLRVFTGAGAYRQFGAVSWNFALGNDERYKLLLLREKGDDSWVQQPFPDDGSSFYLFTSQDWVITHMAPNAAIHVSRGPLTLVGHRLTDVFQFSTDPGKELTGVIPQV